MLRALTVENIRNRLTAFLVGLKVLLLEARDRIGGRSWSSNIDGYPYEIGGTWVYWGQATVWREIARYGMQDDLEISYDFSRGVNQYFLASAQGTQRFSHDEEVSPRIPCSRYEKPRANVVALKDALMESALSKLVNVDGQHGRQVVPFPHSGVLTPEARKYDHMSVADRLADIKNNLTPNERLCVEAFVLLCSGGTLETTSFYEFLHWWALSGYSYEGCINHLVKYKFKGGQSSFAVRFFDEALATGNLTYAFNQPVASVKDNGNQVQVTTRAGQTFTAAKMISAVPLNVLSDVKFDPPLEPGRQTAAKIGHVNQTIKVHAEVSDRDLRSFTGISYPHNGLIYGFGDGETPVGNTHIVAFGGQHNHFHPEDSIEHTMNAMKGFTPMNIERLVRLAFAYQITACANEIAARCSTIGLETSLRKVPGKYYCPLWFHAQARLTFE